MVYRLYLEDGDYRDKTTKEPRNLVYGEIVYTPEGINVGWIEFETLELAMDYFNLELKDVILNQNL